jgi:iduronate 2-sulfatase
MKPKMKNYCNLKPAVFLSATFLSWMPSPGTASQPENPACDLSEKKMNVLFIAIDDLRPELNCYGNSRVISPNIDRLASQGLLFEQAHCQQAICAPSRASMLTSLRPDFTGVHNLGTHFRKTVPDVVTLPQHFKNHGYHTQAIGKIYHGSFEVLARNHKDPQSWSVPDWLPEPRYYYTQEGIRIAREMFSRSNAVKNGAPIDDWVNHFVRGLTTEAPEVHDTVLQDGQIANRAIEALRNIHGKSFFLAVGFLKPHIPFITPKKYWDLYNRDEIPVAENRNRPENSPDIAFPPQTEMIDYYDIDDEWNISEEKARELIHGYYACVSYVDAQIGRLVKELEQLNLIENTIIVIWGDHGWKLGEYNSWSKLTNFDLDTRAPLIISSPGHKHAGSKTQSIVEFIDIYPTLSELCNLPVPEHCQGVSMIPLFENPGHKLKEAAYSQYPRQQREIMGYTMRTEKYRYTEWIKNDTVFERELYDHQVDQGESRNLEGDANYRQLIPELSLMLKKGRNTNKGTN